MPRPCHKCHRNIDFIEIPGRKGMTVVDAVPALVMVDPAGPWIGWDKRRLAPVHGWVMDRTKPKEETEAIAKAKGKSLAWAWVPHFRSCPARGQASPPAAPQGSQAPRERSRATEAAEAQGRLF